MCTTALDFECMVKQFLEHSTGSNMALKKRDEKSEIKF